MVRVIRKKKGKYLSLSGKAQRQLLAEFCEALLSLKKTEEAVNFLVDLLSKSEALMLAKRIKIAKLLLEGKSYRDIESKLSISHSTVARVNEWLSEAGEGFRLIADRASDKELEPSVDFDSKMEEWRSIKRKYPMYYWPQLLIEGVIIAANQRQKEQIRGALEKLDKKSKVYKQVDMILKSSGNN